MKKIKITELKKYLKTKTNDELINEIVEIFRMNKQVQDYYGVKVSPENEEKLLEEYKENVINQFFPTRSSDVLNYSILKKLIAEFKKIATKDENIIELLLVYAENGVDFTNRYGDIDERFYNNISRVYEEALVLIQKNDLEEKFIEKAKIIMYEASGIGWGFGDFLVELYYEAFDIFDDK